MTTVTTNIKLLGCPFCGASAKIQWIEAYSTDSSFNTISCISCPANMECEDPPTDEEIKLWNTRAS